MHFVAPALGPAWLDPQTILDALGPWALWGAAAIVFAECGLLIGFLLPGDSLLFTVGLLAATGVLDQPVWLACVVLTVMAFIGNVCGYEIGRRTGPAIFRENSRIFKPEYVEKTVEFFDRYGNRAIVLARFVPIVRTFITVTAGVGRMDRRRYLIYSGLGGILWATGVTVLGALLGQIPFISANIEAILLLIVLVSVVPIVVEFLRERAKSRRRAAQGAAGAAGVVAADPAGVVAADPAGGTVDRADEIVDPTTRNFEVGAPATTGRGHLPVPEAAAGGGAATWNEPGWDKPAWDGSAWDGSGRNGSGRNGSGWNGSGWDESGSSARPRQSRGGRHAI